MNNNKEYYIKLFYNYLDDKLSNVYQLIPTPAYYNMIKIMSRRAADIREKCIKLKNLSLDDFVTELKNISVDEIGIPNVVECQKMLIKCLTTDFKYQIENINNDRMKLYKLWTIEWVYDLADLIDKD